MSVSVHRVDHNQPLCAAEHTQYSSFAGGVGQLHRTKYVYISQSIGSAPMKSPLKPSRIRSIHTCGVAAPRMATNEAAINKDNHNMVVVVVVMVMVCRH
jgi:hypothetical protein